jgi:hypothetical protein
MPKSWLTLQQTSLAIEHVFVRPPIHAVTCIYGCTARTCAYLLLIRQREGRRDKALALIALYLELALEYLG